MHVEIEIKAALQDPEAMKQKLLALGATFKGQHYQHDILLDPPNVNFAETDQVLRIRNTNGTWKLDYKTKRLDDETKSRKEYSLVVEDGNQLKEIFSLMQYKLVGEIEKTRDNYTCDGITITIDNVTHLGHFIEVEILSAEEQFAANKEKLFTFLNTLGIKETIKKDYLELLWEKGFYRSP